MGDNSTIFYDPLGRVVSTLHPNHSYEKIVFNPWKQEMWDVNDTILVSDPQNDPAVGKFFTRLLTSDYLPSWYDLRKNAEKGIEEQRQQIIRPSIRRLLQNTILTLLDEPS